ncbi:MAG: helix-turn-helix transcriptional regulator [Burkholderiales bacterium]|nr:helix-turn-helix transcriptional regulator [Burkholderiales bacterium]
MSRRLGGNIAALRKARGWTQSSLAERIGVDTETISRFERGATLPSLLTLEKISKSLRVRIGDLLTESSAQPDDQASTLSAWLDELGESDREFVLDLIKRTCDHLRSS